MEIKKTKNNMNSYNFELIKDDKSLKISFSGALDLHMSLSDGKIIPDNENVSIYFDITKEHYDLFALFDALYKSIISCNIFEDKKLNKNLFLSYEYHILVDENKNINWVSDDGPFELEDMLRISKYDDDTYRLTFIRNDKELDFGYKSSRKISVRFRNSGSRYKPFNVPFMKMYQELHNIDLNFHQMHIEEISYIRKLNRKI